MEIYVSHMVCVNQIALEKKGEYLKILVGIYGDGKRKKKQSKEYRHLFIIEEGQELKFYLRLLLV